MIGTFQALLVALIAVLPGALYTIALENGGAAWAWRRTDTATQIFRFLGASAVFQAIFAPVTYWAYRELILTHVLIQGGPVAWYWWPILLAYLIVPYAWGQLTEGSRDWRLDSEDVAVEKGFRHRIAKFVRQLTRLLKVGINKLVGLYSTRDPEPRAWDRLFSKKNLGGYVRLKLTDGEWKAGLWYGSYASGYGEDGDLYIAQQVEVDEHGELVADDDRDPVLVGWGLLIRWSEVHYLEFAEIGDNGSDGSGDGEQGKQEGIGIREKGRWLSVGPPEEDSSQGSD